MEPKNLTRQNFISIDVGKNKAEVLAERYSSSYGIQIDCIPEYLPSNHGKAQTMIADYLRAEQKNAILIGCVDNNKTRHVLHNIYNNTRLIDTYLDSGNEETAGQVVYSTKCTLITTHLHPIVIKDVVTKFDLSNEDKHPEEISCAEHTLSAPQDITTNIMAANILLNYCSIYARNSSAINYAQTNGTTMENYEIIIKGLDGIINHVTYFNSKTNSISRDEFKLEEIELSQENYDRMERFRRS